MPTNPLASISRKQLQITGVVQGVGFRPFVYKLARSFALSGYVCNTAFGVTIEVEGTSAAVEQFVNSLHISAPPLAAITDITKTDLPPQGKSEFAIRQSVPAEAAFALISYDVATCEDCWREFGDPSNRRYGYPFTNCTNCGPRYTIVKDIPYDRAQTTMAVFSMCSVCLAEYEDPQDRRFHAQPNACAVCGPALVLVQRGSQVSKTVDVSAIASSSLDTLRKVRGLLRSGRIVAIKGLGGFLLACDAGNADAIDRLRQRKRRSDKPFALMTRDISSAESLCVLTDADRTALQSPRRPIVILPRRQESNIPEGIAPGNKSIGVMLPCTPLHYLLFSDSPDEPTEFTALVMTSGNVSEEPIVTSNEDAWQRLELVADWFLFHNRDICMRADDSVVRVFQGSERVLRRARGYAPQPVDLGFEAHELLACGAELKNTFCLTKERYAILSQHIGDLENYETFKLFEETLANLKKLFRVEPRAVAYDLHPNYRSSRFALALPVERKIGVQHHHAHIASCMAENHLHGEVIGVALDGTGYGTDGKIWGGEFLIAGFAGFQRRAHLRYVALPGGDAAVRQPWRMALSHLRDTFGSGALPDLSLFRDVPEKQMSLADAMIARRIHTLETSSCGRLFDAVAALVGLGGHVSFEGQAAIALESAAQHAVEERYGFLIAEGEPMEIDMRPAIAEIVEDLTRQKEISYISACFHNTVAAAIVEVCQLLRQQEGLSRVCLSGGVFQNVYLLERTVKGLYGCAFEVFLHALVPPNDGGISLGQAVIANELLS